MIRAILACDEAWGIGKDGTLPWPHNPADQKWFADTTRNSTVVMGRTTWEDPDMPSPLLNRVNIVISSANVNGASTTYTIQEAMSILPQQEQDMWIIGGAQLVKSLLPIIKELWLSRIYGVYECDTTLPKNDILANYSLYDVEASDKLHIEKWEKYEEAK